MPLSSGKKNQGSIVPLMLRESTVGKKLCAIVKVTLQGPLESGPSGLRGPNAVVRGKQVGENKSTCVGVGERAHFLELRMYSLCL